MVVLMLTETSGLVLGLNNFLWQEVPQLSYWISEGFPLSDLEAPTF